MLLLLLVYQAKRASLPSGDGLACHDKLSLLIHAYVMYVDVFQHPEVKKWAAELKSLRNEHSKQTA